MLSARQCRMRGVLPIVMTPVRLELEKDLTGAYVLAVGTMPKTPDVTSSLRWRCFVVWIVLGRRSAGIPAIETPANPIRD